MRVAFLLSRWPFLEVLEYLGSFSILVAAIFYFSESGDRLKQKHYQACQAINTAQSKGGSGGPIEALQELGDDVSGAFLRGALAQGTLANRYFPFGQTLVPRDPGSVNNNWP